MFLDFIATAAAAFAAAGIVLFLVRVLRIRLPKWILPVGAGAAMLGYAIWSEHSWFPRVTAALPPATEVAWNNEETSWWRPWTYLVPLTTRFIAVNKGSIKTHEAAPGQRLAEVLLIARWQGTITVPVLFDCEGARRADLLGGAEFGPDGAVVGAEWHQLPADDPVLFVACSEG
ncbi:MAG: hypothetical protein OEM24_12365 [Paracoccaceae bacterium]|nr:hypothetical protein [Paracoccaceae bacterium]